jgi:hypothetical protein
VSTRAHSSVHLTAIRTLLCARPTTYIVRRPNTREDAMNTRSPLKNSLLAFLTFRDLPSADSLAWSIHDLIDEHIKAGRPPALTPPPYYPQPAPTENNAPWTVAPSPKPYQPYTLAPAKPVPSPCQHDLFAKDNTLMLTYRTVTCEHCDRSFKL